MGETNNIFEIKVKFIFIILKKLFKYTNKNTNLNNRI